MDSDKKIPHVSQVLFEYFNSINIFFPKKEKIEEFTDRLVDYWIPEYVCWHKKMSLSSLYRRLPSAYPVINIKGDNVLSCINNTTKILSAGQSIGFALAVSLTGLDYLNNQDVFNELCAENIIKYITVSLPDDIPDEFILFLITLSNKYNFYLTLNISLQKINSDIFSSAQFGGQNIHIVINNESKRKYIIDLSERGAYNTSCVPYFVISINEDGDIFPCQSLISVKIARLGNIYDDFFTTSFVKSQYSLDLYSLAIEGINKCEISFNEIESDGRFPLICNIHRRILSNEANSAA